MRHPTGPWQDSCHRWPYSAKRVHHPSPLVVGICPPRLKHKVDTRKRRGVKNMREIRTLKETSVRFFAARLVQLDPLYESVWPLRSRRRNTSPTGRRRNSVSQVPVDAQPATSCYIGGVLSKSLLVTVTQSSFQISKSLTLPSNFHAGFAANYLATGKLFQFHLVVQYSIRTCHAILTGLVFGGILQHRRSGRKLPLLTPATRNDVEWLARTNHGQHSMFSRVWHTLELAATLTAGCTAVIQRRHSLHLHSHRTALLWVNASKPG